MEQSVVHELTELEKREAIFWRKRAKTRWAEEGGLNTHYFHVTTLIHRRYNRINYILNSRNSWINDRQQIGEEFEVHFRSNFTIVNPPCPHNLKEFISLVITTTINSELTACQTNLEVYQAIFSMGAYKSLGPNRMAVMFYKHCWGIIYEAVVAEIQNFFTNGMVKPSFNHTFIALIPKVQGVSKVAQLRPIVICNITLKVIAKIIAGRLRKYMERIVHPNQAAFILNRAIRDNIVINHEVMWYMNQKKGRAGFMVIKIDLAKAYDRVK